jgi:hypothetical protein
VPFKKIAPIKEQKRPTGSAAVPLQMQLTCVKIDLLRGKTDLLRSKRDLLDLPRYLKSYLCKCDLQVSRAHNRQGMHVP